MGQRRKGKGAGVTGLVLAYGRYEDSLPGFEMWGREDAYEPFPNTWEALRSLSRLMFELYKEDLEDRHQRRGSQCCAFYKGKKLSAVLLAPVAKGRDRTVKACPECGTPIDNGFEYDPEEFQNWILDRYTKPAHAQPEFEYQEEWCRDRYDLFRASKGSWPLVEEAEVVLVIALPVDLVPSELLEEHEIHIEHYKQYLEDNMEAALKEWEDAR